MPGRFTENWLAANVPNLHPGQVPALLKELRARGWSDERIEARVQRYLATNPYLTERRPAGESPATAGPAAGRAGI